VDLAGVALATPLLVLVPGALAAAHLPFLRPDERSALAGGLGLGLLATSALVAHLLPAPPWTVNAALWLLIVLAGLAALRMRRLPLASSFSWPLLGLWALFDLALVGYQGMTPIYAGGNWYGDWWEHYSIAQAYVRTAGGHETVWFGDYNLASRTPLFNLVTAFALSLFGDRFWVYQVASTAASTLFLPATVLLLRPLRGARAALLTAAFVFVNTWLVHDALFTWAKMTAAFFLLLALHFYLRWRAGAAAWALHLTAVTGALAFMSHQSAAYYLAGLVADYVFLRPRPRASWREAVTAALLAAVIVAPWHWWVSGLYGVVGAVKANPVLSTGRPTIARVLRGGTENAITSLLPIPFLDFLRGGRFTGDRSLFRGVELYFNSLTGAMTLSLLAALLVTARRPSSALARAYHHLRGPWLMAGFGAVMLATLAVERPRYAMRADGPGPFVWAYAAGLVAFGLWTLRRRPEGAAPGYSPHMAVALFALAGYWGGLLAHPGGEINGIASNAMVPSVLIVVGYAVARVARMLDRRLLAAVAAGVLAEFAITWAHLARLRSGGPPFADDINHRLKADHGLVFLYDAAGGEWRPFAVLALLAQVLAMIAIRHRIVVESRSSEAP
jgi:hypothetical protein